MYYRLYIRYHEHDNNYLEICRCYRSIYETEAVAADPEQWQPVSSAPSAAAVCHFLPLICGEFLDLELYVSCFIESSGELREGTWTFMHP